MSALSQIQAVDGHRFMTNIPNSPDLPAIAYEAEVEIRIAETIEAAAPMSDDAAHTFDTTEIGYYEAELRSLRDAATTLNEAEQQPG
jgi:hypothetical protein